MLDQLLARVGERLSEQSVTVFRRICIAQDSADEVASELGMTLGAARVAQHRVLKALKEEGAGILEC